VTADAGAERLCFTNLHKGFDGTPVLQGFTAEVPLDRITFVVGRSGSGKSVLCRLAVGLLRPEAGEVELLGQRVDALPERSLVALRAQVPYVVQGPALLDWLSVRRNVALARPGASPDEVEDLLARVGLTELAERHPSGLGPGVQKRVAIARALMLAPRYLLFDEPTTGLDRRAARQVNAELRALKAGGLGALVVSHDYGSLAEVADGVLGVAEGRAAFHLSAEGFFQSDHPAARALLGPGEQTR